MIKLLLPLAHFHTIADDDGKGEFYFFKVSMGWADDVNTDILTIPDAGDDDRGKWGNYSDCSYDHDYDNSDCRYDQ